MAPENQATQEQSPRAEREEDSDDRMRRHLPPRPIFVCDQEAFLDLVTGRGIESDGRSGGRR